MIHTNRIVTVGEQESIIDRPIVLYRGDREVEIEFTLVGNEFTFSEEGNVIKSVNASHGQLVLNTPSGENMFSELAECHEGKVVFVVTKEMIDEFIEMGFYSFQIRLYDSVEMKSRVTIPPVMNGFDIRNPIAAEDETNVVDQGIVDYARIFKDQSNEELPTFTWDGQYVKTEWAHHDVITENKMNKIEDALYSINANVKESDVVILNTLDQVKKDADAYVKAHMADVEEFERNLNTDVQKFKIDTNAAMTAHKNEVSEELENVNMQLAQIEKKTGDYILISPEENSNITNDILEAFDEYNHVKIAKGTYYIDKVTLPKSNLTLSSEEGATLFLNGMTGIYAYDKENIKIKNINLNGNGILDSSNSANGSSAIYFSKCNNIFVENVKTDNTGAWGVVVTNYSTNISINNCICSGSIRQSGIAISGNCDNFNITNNKAYSNYYAGIIVEPNCSNGFINNNIVYENIEGGIDIVHNPNANIEVSNNIVRDNTKLGIVCINSSFVNMFNNTVSSSGTNGFYCSDVLSCTFKNNVVTNTNKCGFYVVKTSLEDRMTDIIIVDNTVLNSCLTGTEAHEASFFIRDCDELIFKNNVSKSSKKDYTFTANTYKVLDIEKGTTASSSSDLGLPIKPFKFTFNLDSSNKSVSVVAPYDMRVYGYKLKRKIVNTSSDNTVYTLIKFNNVNYGRHENEQENVGNILYTTYLAHKNIVEGEIFTISYAHSYDNNYVTDLELELLYY